MNLKEVGPAFPASRMNKEEQDEFNAIESEVRESEQERSFIEYAATLIESVKERLEIDKQRGKTELSEFEEEVYKTINKRMEEARGSFEPTFGSGSLAEETIRAEGNQTLTCQRNVSQGLLCAALQ